ncbi:MAG TPA: S9 family peptidase [Xanthomonadaceae bacterium]|nr:S9 family peptidase [Xanthomonadaceae bacterium]
MPHPFRGDDLFKYRTLGKLAGGSGHDWVSVSIRRATRDGESYDSGLWGLRTGSDDAPQRLTVPAFSALYARFDGEGKRLAFLSKRGDGEGKQVHVLNMLGGEAQPVGDAGKLRLSSILDWSSDGKRLLLLASVPCEEDGEEQLPGDGAKPSVIRFVPYKLDGSGITVGERVHLHALDLESGEYAAVTQGDFDADTAAWSPDGHRLAFVRRSSGRLRHRSELWRADTHGAEATLWDDSFASIGHIAWSPDGRRLAFTASQREGDSIRYLWIVDADGGAARRIAGELEVAPSSTLHWHGDGRCVALLSEHEGLIGIAVVDVESGQVRRIPAPMRGLTALAASGDRLCFVAASMRQLEEVYSCTWDGSDEKRHSAFNRNWFRRRERPHVSRRRYTVPDGNGGEERIDAWLLRPAKRAPPYPLLVDMHGGPHSTVSIDFSMHTYWYLLLSRGWAILAPNAVGSTSYGQPFADRLRGRWGELDLPQYEAIVRTLQQEGVVDERIACAGKSYGGFLSAWAAAHSDMFRAAIVAAPVANMESHMGTSDTGYYVTPFAMDGGPREAREVYRRLSPVYVCDRVNAAMLILQGEEDERCPRGQSEELFVQMMRCSPAPVELVMYPGSSHSEAESGKPANRMDYHTRIADWLCKHVQRPREAELVSSAHTSPEHALSEQALSEHALSEQAALDRPGGARAEAPDFVANPEVAERQASRLRGEQHGPHAAPRAAEKTGKAA